MPMMETSIEMISGMSFYAVSFSLSFCLQQMRTAHKEYIISKMAKMEKSEHLRMKNAYTAAYVQGMVVKDAERLSFRAFCLRISYWYPGPRLQPVMILPGSNP
jgi:hypothetical protein